VRGTSRDLQDRKASLEDAIVGELRAIIGALQGEVEFEAAGGDRSSCAGTVGCDIEQLPLKTEIRQADARRSRAS
jgi:hypothetical protein